jgi:hypothetical protein
MLPPYSPLQQIRGNLLNGKLYSCSGKELPFSMPEPYPISQDHLIPLIQYNVYRASITNILILGLHELIPADQRKIPILFPPPAVIPDSLQPTPLQKTLPHASWIDILPCAKMRDNAIRTSHNFDENELCRDVLGYGNQELNCHMIVWSDPWDPAGWEFSVGFMRKWGFLLRGCDRLLRETNRWRALRGEKPIIWELN